MYNQTHTMIVNLPINVNISFNLNKIQNINIIYLIFLRCEYFGPKILLLFVLGLLGLKNEYIVLIVRVSNMYSHSGTKSHFITTLKVTYDLFMTPSLIHIFMRYIKAQPTLRLVFLC